MVGAIRDGTPCAWAPPHHPHSPGVPTASCKAFRLPVLGGRGPSCRCFSDTQSCLTLCDPMDCSLPDSPVHGDSPGKNDGVGCHFLLQGILPTQGSNPHLLHWQGDSLPLAPTGNPLPIIKGRQPESQSS